MCVTSQSLDCGSLHCYAADTRGHSFEQPRQGGEVPLAALVKAIAVKQPLEGTLPALQGCHFVPVHIKAHQLQWLAYKVTEGVDEGCRQVAQHRSTHALLEAVRAQTRLMST